MSIGAGRLSVENTTRSPAARAPTGGCRRAHRLVRAPRGPWERRSPWGSDAGGGPHPARRWDSRPRRRSPRGGGASGRPPVTGGAWEDGRGARAVPRLAGARVDGGLRGPACASRAARVRKWVRIWSITDVWVMQATRRIAPWQDGHASGSTSKICCRSAVVGPSPTGGWPRWARVGARG